MGTLTPLTMFRAAPKSSRALCQKNKNKSNLIVLSKCNSAIPVLTISCFVLALITVKEHMVMDPEMGFTKSFVALMMNKCEDARLGISLKTVSS